MTGEIASAARAAPPRDADARERRRARRLAVDRAVHLREARRPDIESGRLLNVGGGGMLLAGRSALAVGAVIDVGMAAGLRGRPPHLFRVRVVRVEKKKLRQPRWWAATRTAYLYGCEVLAGLSPAGDAAAH